MYVRSISCELIRLVRRHLTTGLGGRALIDPILAGQSISGVLQLVLSEQFQLDTQSQPGSWLEGQLFAAEDILCSHSMISVPSGPGSLQQ